MKGVVFTEFFELVESKFGYEMVDQIIRDSRLASGGVYTSIGTYDHGEMTQLLTHLSRRSGIAPEDLLNVFGHHLFAVFQKNYGSFFQECPNAFDFLSGIERHIHVEVKKLYPDAELPRFEITRDADRKLEMVYHSERRMAHLALGLIEATLQHYREPASVRVEPLDDTGTQVRFVLEKQA